MYCIENCDCSIFARYCVTEVHYEWNTFDKMSIYQFLGQTCKDQKKYCRRFIELAKMNKAKQSQWMKLEYFLNNNQCYCRWCYESTNEFDCDSIMKEKLDILTKLFGNELKEKYLKICDNDDFIGDMLRDLELECKKEPMN